MIDNVVLESIESFLKNEVAPEIKLMVPNDEDIRDYQLMHPNVFIGWIPPPNQLKDVPLQLDNGIKRALPAMVVGMDEGEDDGDQAGIDIRISFIVYNPGLYSPEGEWFTPNLKGYQDLLNLIFICRQKLSNDYLLNDGKTTAQKPFKWGMYPEQPVGYWVGWLTFRAGAAVLPYINKQDINLDF